MKYITLIIGLLVVGCGKQEQTTTEKPVKELTAEDVVGSYEAKLGEDTWKEVLLENGITESYVNGKKVSEAKWSISKEGEMHVTEKDGDIAVLRINKDGSITVIARIVDGKRKDIPEDQQTRYDKIQ